MHTNLPSDRHIPDRPLCTNCGARLQDIENMWRLTCAGSPLDARLTKPGGEEMKLVQDILVHLHCKNNFVELLATQIVEGKEHPDLLGVYQVPMSLDLQFLERAIIRATQIPVEYLIRQGS